MKTPCFITQRIGIALVVVLVPLTYEVSAQPGSLDTNFSADIITGEVGFSAAVQPDGKLIAVGTFGVIRFLGDGKMDRSFQSIPRGLVPYSGPGRGVGAVVLQPDGRILVTGNFTNAAGTPLPSVLRLKSDGTIDPSFNLDPEVHSSGRVLALQPDGKLITDGLVRLNSDGSVDPGFVTSWYNSSAEFHALALSPNGKIYFATSEGIGRVNSDGSRDESFNPQLGLGPFGALALQPDGKLIIGQYSDGAGFKSVRRLLPNGTDDPSWTPPDVNGGDAVVYALLIQPDGKVIVGGNNLEALNGVPNAHLARLNPDGSVDTAFDTGADFHYYSVEDMALAPDGKIFVAGTQFTRPEISLAPGTWRLNNDPGMQPHLEISLTEKHGILLGLRGQAGATYRVEYREQFSGGSWTPVTNLTLSGTFITWDTGKASSPSRFYRAVSPP